MKTITQHTPTPWQMESSVYGGSWTGTIRDNEGKYLGEMSDSPNSKSMLPILNAQHLINAVNSYEALLRAAKAALRCPKIYETDQETGETPFDLLSRAIAQAEGGTQ